MSAWKSGYSIEHDFDMQLNLDNLEIRMRISWYFITFSKRNRAEFQQLKASKNQRMNIFSPT